MNDYSKNQKSFSIPQDYDPQFRSNSLPAFNQYNAYNNTPPPPPPTYNNNNNSSAAMNNNPASCDLQDVIYYYQSQPELLRLILLSKVEEDKRKAEEAKLRAKELDMFLLQQQPNTPDNSMYTSTSTPMKRPSVLDLLMDDSENRRDSALGSSFDSSPQSDEMDTNATNTSTNTPSMLSMSFPPTQQPINNRHPLSPPYPPTDDTTTTFSSPLKNDSYFPQRPRRRREMQAISKIVETRDYPYIDGFFWKNNGNTIQKKTGNKSVYYKCSNSSKGCPVNKTVTWKENGEYLIKYRGEHLPDCGKVQRIVDM